MKCKKCGSTNLLHVSCVEGALVCNDCGNFQKDRD
jgi:transcription initiation factor TFIIIB Brf1 subunit/transcription initiation factor TFIIB